VIKTLVTFWWLEYYGALEDGSITSFYYVKQRCTKNVWNNLVRLDFKFRA
jgi:hypothetical protein